MADFNKVFLIGRLTKDPELRYTPSGAAVTTLRLATSRSYAGKDGERKEESLFIDVTVWNRQAENCCQYLGKGRLVHVEGYLKMDKWSDRETGAERSQIKVVADNVQFLEGRRNDDTSQTSYHGEDEHDSAPAPPPRRSAPSNGTARSSYAPSGGDPGPAPRRPSAPPPPAEDAEDDIPF